VDDWKLKWTAFIL